MFEEQACRFVKQRPARQVGAAADADEVLIEQTLQRTIDSHAAHRFDGGVGDRLAIGDDRQGFERRLAEPLGFAVREKPAHPRTILGPVRMRQPDTRLLEGEGATFRLIRCAQFGKRRRHLRFGYLSEVASPGCGLRRPRLPNAARFRAQTRLSA